MAGFCGPQGTTQAMPPSEHGDAGARKARFDQELAALRDRYLRHMEDEDRELLEAAILEDQELIHHFHNLLTAALEPDQVAKFLLGAARHLRHDGDPNMRKAPVLAGIYALIPESR